jgi:superfamily II DNA or RNA helicase
MHIAVPVPGDVVWIRQRRWRVERARRDRNVLRLDVRNRDERLTFLAPFDRPAAIARRERTSRVRAAHAMARLAHLVSRTFTWSTLMSARDADIDILPYQLEPALAMLAGARRVLLADEVGLGKTIQAGLAIAEMHRRSPGARTLVLVPAALRDQWVDELGRRFRLQCHAADRQRLDEHARHGLHGDDPWRRPGVWIASFDFLKQRHVMDGLPIEPWDLLILDEVHVVCGDSERHEACTELAQRARQVMLISATPHTGEDARFARLMNLGRLNDADMAPVMVRRTRRDVGFDLPRNVRWHRIRPAKPELALFQALGEFEAAALQTAARVHREAAILLLAVFRKRALSTIRALRISLDRRLAWLGDGQRAADFDWLQPRLAFEDDTDEADETDREALTADIGLRSAAERSWLRRLRGLAEAAGRCESKVSYVTTLISRAREPVVVFTEFRHSLEVLQRRLQTTSAVAVLHGGLTPHERRQQLDRFLSGGATVLLATDVGGQGLNLQDRTRWVITLELPWNPLRLEQRCGRVDRIGQSKPVHFTVIVARHAFETGVLARLAQRMLAARRMFEDDVTSRVVPDAVAVGAALFEHGGLDEPAAAGRPDFAPSALRRGRPVRICRKWTRPACVIARRLLASRLLSRRWQAPADDAPDAVWTAIDRVPAIRRLAGDRSVLVFSVPLLDGAGAVVEHHVVSLCVEDHTQVDAARARAKNALAARARRLTARLRRQLHDRVGADTALASRVLTNVNPRELQPGLFDQRELRVFEASRAEAEMHKRRLDDRHFGWERETAVKVGRPILELAFLARR